MDQQELDAAVTVFSSGARCQEAGSVSPAGRVPGLTPSTPSLPLHSSCFAVVFFFPSAQQGSSRCTGEIRSPWHLQESQCGSAFSLLSWQKLPGEIPLGLQLHLPATLYAQSPRGRVPDLTKHNAFASNMYRLARLNEEGKDLQMPL